MRWIGLSSTLIIGTWPVPYFINPGRHEILCDDLRGNWTQNVKFHKVIFPLLKQQKKKNSNCGSSSMFLIDLSFQNQSLMMACTVSEKLLLLTPRGIYLWSSFYIIFIFGCCFFCGGGGVLGDNFHKFLFDRL